MNQLPDIKENYLKEKVQRLQLVKKSIEQMKKRHEDELKPLTQLLEGYERQIQGFMQKLGIRFTKTEYGDPGIYERISFHVEDQDAFKTHVITSKAWDLLVWAVRRTAAESYKVTHKQYPPGVAVTSELKLRVTAPTPLGRKRLIKKGEEEEKEFDPFSE